MYIGKVIGPVVATIKHEFLSSRKLLLVKEVFPDGTLGERPVIGIDFVQAGAGDTVLVMKNGPSMDGLVDEDRVPANTAIIGVIDDIYVGEKER